MGIGERWQGFYGRADAQHRIKLRTRLTGPLAAEPSPVGRLHHWRHVELRSCMLESAHRASKMQGG